MLVATKRKHLKAKWRAKTLYVKGARMPMAANIKAVEKHLRSLDPLTIRIYCIPFCNCTLAGCGVNVAVNVAQAQCTWRARLLSHYMNAFWNIQKYLDSGAPDSCLQISAQGQKESTQQDKE